MCQTYPYPNDIGLLDDWFEWLRCRAGRVVDEREPLPLKFPIERVKANQDWKCREKASRQVIEDRLTAHRSDPNAPALGLELLRDVHGLNNNEMIILVALTCVAISEQLASEILGEFSAAPFGLPVSDLMDLLRPCCKPWGLEDLLAFRRYFRSGGRLVDAGLIAVDIKDEAPPAELSGAWVNLTAKAFKIITGAES